MSWQRATCFDFSPRTSLFSCDRCQQNHFQSLGGHWAAFDTWDRVGGERITPTNVLRPWRKEIRLATVTEQKIPVSGVSSGLRSPDPKIVSRNLISPALGLVRYDTESRVNYINTGLVAQTAPSNLTTRKSGARHNKKSPKRGLSMVKPHNG
jgi:hypothetical protein